MTEGRKYSDAEVRAILDRALKPGDGGEPGLSHADLLAIGEQVGVSPEAMTRAAAEARSAQLDQAATRAITARRRRWLAAHAAVFATINGLLFAVNAATTPGEWWVLFPVVFWGLALALHAGLALGIPASKRALERERKRLEAPSAARSARLRVEPTALETEEATTTEAETAVTATERRS
jgi:hypothetical protein